MDLTTYELDNGMKVILRPKTTAPVVACNVWVGVGSADETPEEAGLAHVHEHMLFKGTDRRGVGELAREVEASGGHINAFTSFDQTCYYVAMSSRYLEAGLDILSDAVRNSSFDADELSRELEVIREEIKRTKDSPAKMTGLRLFETAFDEHPYRFPVIGTDDSVSGFGREDVVNFFERHYVPVNMALVVAGDFDEDEIRPKIDEYFGSWGREAGYAPAERAVEPTQTGFRARTVAEDLQQAHLRVGFHIPDAMDEDIPALDLLGAIMGYGNASHLVQTIQRERQWVNSISASAYTPKDAGLFIISGNYQIGEDEQRGHDDTLRAIMEEVFRFREMRVSDRDLQRARTIIESQEIYGKQTVEGLAMKHGHYQMVTGDPEYEQKYYAQLREVGPDDIRRVAREYLTPHNASVVLSYPEDGAGVDEAALQEATEEATSVVEAEAVDGAMQLDEDGFVRLELPDGPTMIVQEDHSVETFSIRGLTLGGTRHEAPEKAGVNKLMSKLLTKGTDNRTAVEISHEVESMAGSLSGMTGRNTSGLSMSGLSRFFEDSFEIFADCLLGATFPDGEFEREKMMLIQGIRGRRDKLGAVNTDQYLEAFFAPHPYGRPKVGTEETVANLSVEDVRQFHDRVVSPQDLVLVVVGDVEARRVRELAERYFVRPEAPEPYRPEIPKVPEHGRAELVAGDLEKEQAHVIVGFDGPQLGTDEQYALRVLYAVLSGQGGRLFYELRDRKSLAYSIHASTLMGLDAATFTINIGTSPSKIEEAVEGIFEQVRRLRREGVTDEEIRRAKRYLVGNHDIGLQKNSSRALTVGLDELYGLGYKRSMDYGEKIEAVDAADIQAVIDKYLVPERSVTSITKPEGVEVPSDLVEQLLGE